ARPSCPPGSCRAATVGQNPEEPGIEPCWISTLRQRAVGSHERILKRLLSVLALTQHVDREAGIALAVPRHESPVSFRVSVENLRDEGRVGPIRHRGTDSVR